jgi:hypothetical protein
MVGAGGGELRRAVPARSYRLSRWLALRGLGAVAAVAFASLGVQVEGLLGSDGILPATETLAALERFHGEARFWRAPSLFWLGAGDAALLFSCAAGVALSLGLALGFAPRLALALLWALYLSFATVGDVFLGYQWDALLIEALLAALLLAPAGWRDSRAAPEPSRLALLPLRFVLFKLMWLSGAAKLASGDPTWRDLSALEYHYWTQPLPTWTAVYADGLPDAFHALSVVVTLAVELALPFALWIPGRSRRLAALGTIGFQGFLAATGNFAFFNWLTIVLCLPFLDDALLLRALPRRLRARLAPPPVAAPPPGRLRRVGLALVAGSLLGANALVLAQRLLPPAALPGPAIDVLECLAPWRSVNGYGLFAVMTTERPEIAVEGSAEGTTWRAYGFRWKPDRLEERPRFVAPHQPRLDWQMWFGALRGCSRSPWFLRFAQRLLEGSAPVRALLAEDPFPDAPPRYLRTQVERYRFATPEERSRGLWWRREEPGLPYCPVLTLEDGRLVAVP